MITEEHVAINKNAEVVQLTTKSKTMLNGAKIKLIDMYMDKNVSMYTWDNNGKQSIFITGIALKAFKGGAENPLRELGGVFSSPYITKNERVAGWFYKFDKRADVVNWLTNTTLPENWKELINKRVKARKTTKKLAKVANNQQAKEIAFKVANFTPEQLIEISTGLSAPDKKAFLVKHGLL